MYEDALETDLEDCLTDYMIDNFNVDLDDNSAREIGTILLRIKAELVESLKTSGTFTSLQLEKLIAFNEKNKEYNAV
jgi:hypothetical protein